MLLSTRTRVVTLLFTTVFLVFWNPAHADFFDELKGAASKTLDAVKDVTDSVELGKRLGREAGKTRDVILYNDEINLDRDQVYQLQTALNYAGYDAGVADGQMGGKTRRALAAYQADNGFNADGSITRELFFSLTTRGGVSASRPAQSSAALSRSEWQEFQALLNSLGFDGGPADGKPGPKTRRAVQSFKTVRAIDNSASDREVFQQSRLLVSGNSRNDSLTDNASVRQNLTVENYQPSAASDQTANNSTADTSEGIEYSGYGALYKKLMSAWILSEQEHQTEQFLAAAYAYAFEDHELKSDTCNAFNSSSSIEADDKLVALVDRYRRYQQEPGFNASPVTVRYDVARKQPYKNYDLQIGELVLQAHRWTKRANLADGRAGIEFTPCNRMLGLPRVAQAGSNLTVPETFELNIQDFVATLGAQNSGQANVYNSSDAFNMLTRIKMDRNQAAALLEQDKSAILNIGVSVELKHNRKANSARTHFTATKLSINATDELTGETVYKIDLSAPDDNDLPNYVIPRSAPEGSGLPDNLPFHDGAIVLYPSNIVNRLGTTAHAQLALRQLQQKLLLQQNPGLAQDSNTVMYFADLAGSGAGEYLARTSLRELHKKSHTIKWVDVPGFDSKAPQVTTGWQPTEDVFDAERKKQAFVQDFSDKLAGAPITYPLDFVILSEVNIGTYDVNQRGFPLQIYGNDFSPTLGNQIHNLRVAGSYQELDVSKNLSFIRPFKRLPKLWEVPFEEAEAIQDGLKVTYGGIFEGKSQESIDKMLQKNPAMKSMLNSSRNTSATLAVHFRVTGSRYENNKNRGTPLGNLQMDTELVSLKLYSDRRLTQEIAQLPPPQNAIVAKAKADTWSPDTEKRMEPDNFRLLYLNAEGTSETSDDFWLIAAQQRLELERLINQGSWRAFKVSKPYWGRVFSQSRLASRQPLSQEEIQQYRQWTMDRSQSIGHKFTAQWIHGTLKDSQLSIREPGKQIIDGFITILGNHGIRGRDSDDIKKRSRRLSLAEAKSRFPDSSHWTGAFVGADLHVGIALKSDPNWFASEWTSSSPITDTNFGTRALLSVDETHTFTGSDGKPGIIVSFKLDRLQAINNDGSVADLTPQGQPSDGLTTAPIGADQNNTEQKKLAILDVEIGTNIQSAINTIRASFDGPVSENETVSSDPALPVGIRLELTEKVDNAPNSIVDLFVDKEQDKVLAVGRTLSYSRLGITTQQIVNSLTDRYGVPDALIESPPGSNRDTFYLGWGQSASTSAKLKSARFLSDDCILYPWRNYKASDARISTGELRTPCGTYLLAYITDSRAVFLLLNSNDVIERRKSFLLERQREEEEAKKSKATGLKF